MGVEAVIRIARDSYPCLYQGYRQEIFTAILCGASFILGLTMVTRVSTKVYVSTFIIFHLPCTCTACYFIEAVTLLQGGIYVFNLFDIYSASGMTLMFANLFQTIGIGWFYGKFSFSKMISTIVKSLNGTSLQ